jgi:hypothetical protein
MDVELQVILDCPNAWPAQVLLRQALDESGLVAVGIRVTVITSDEEARAVGFGGSPTFRVGGRDLFGPQDSTGLACRVYLTAAGIRPLPELEALRRALVSTVDIAAG